MLKKIFFTSTVYSILYEMLSIFTKWKNGGTDMRFFFF